MCGRGILCGGEERWVISEGRLSGGVVGGVVSQGWVSAKGVTPQVRVSMSCHMKTLVFVFFLAAVQWARPVSLELSGPSSRSASSESGGEQLLDYVGG